MTPNADLIETRLVSIRYLARDTHLYELARPDGGILPPAEAGSHIDIHLTDGMIRQYSLVSPGDKPTRYLVGVKRDAKGQGGSRYMHEQLRVGTLLKFSAPRNNFPLNESAANNVLIAGGIGITPIWCMLQRLKQLGKPYQLYYSCQSRQDMAFLETLEKMDDVHFHFDEESPGKFLDLKSIVASAPKDAHFYCCGPTPMLAAYEEATASIPREQFHIEYFTAKQAAAAEGGFTVELARSKKSVKVAAGMTILAALREIGVDVPSSCEQGVCGACETKIISGKADHRDVILSDAEKAANETMMICCSGCVGDKLVLDL